MDTEVYVFYIDIRATGKGYEEFIKRVQTEFGVKYVRGRVSKLYEENGKVMVRGTDTLLGEQVEIAADLVVLATGINAAAGAKELAQKLNISYDEFGFMKEGHPKLRPVETNTAGVFLAGVCQAPKDIPATVAQASRHGLQGHRPAGQGQAQDQPDDRGGRPEELRVAAGSASRCARSALPRSRSCATATFKSHVIETVCQGCGVCVATCPVNTISLKGFPTDAILDQIEEVLQS